MNMQKKREELAARMDQLHADIKSCMDTLHTKLTWNQYQAFSSIRWSSMDVESAVAKVSKSKKLRRLAIRIDVNREKLLNCRKDMNAILDAIEAREASLSLVYSKPADWYDLTLRKIGKSQPSASKQENKAGLRLVG